MTIGDRRASFLVGGAALVGLALRVIWALWVARAPVGLYDPARYLGYAEQIRTGHGMLEPFSGRPTAYYPPGYPWFLGVVSWLSHPFTDRLPLVVAMVQAVLSSISVVLGAIVAHRLAGRRAAVVAAFALALYPNLVMHAGAILGETLYITLFLAFLVVVPWRIGGETGPARRVAAAGVLLGLAVMVRPISLAIVPLVPVVWWIEGRRGRTGSLGDARPLRRIAPLSGVLLLAVVSCIVPWTVRNAVRMHEFVPISTNTGDNLCIGHAEGATGAFTFNRACDVNYSLLDGPSSEVAGDRARTRVALQAIADDPGREPWLLWQRVYFTWIANGDHDALLALQSFAEDPWMSPSTEHRLSTIADAAYLLVALAGSVGLVLLVIRRRPGGLLLVGSTVLTATVPLLFFGDSRFKVPVMPLLILAAAVLVGVRGPAEPMALEES